MAHAAQEPNFWLEFFRIFVTPLVTWVLVVGGWRFVRNDNNKREDRRELRALLDSIVTDVRLLEENAWQYYQSEVGSENSLLLQVKIKTGQEALGRRLSLLRKLYPDFDYLEPLMHYRHHLTGGDFEQTSREIRPPSDQKFLEISYSANQLVDTLELAYIKTLPKKRQRKRERDAPAISSNTPNSLNP